MTIPDFTDTRLKLQRARKHIEELKALIASFLATDFYRVRIQPSEREGRIEAIFDSLHQPDKQLNVVIGDAIGNLRSALDYLAVAVVSPITGKTHNVGFPFADDVDGFKGMVGAANLSLATDLLTLFVDKIQAYNGGNGHTLWVVNKLRNIDKHRFLVATVQLAGINVGLIDRNNNRIDNLIITVNAGKSGGLFEAPMNYVSFTKKPVPVFEVRIDEPPIIENESVVAFLERAASEIETTLNAFEVAFQS